MATTEDFQSPKNPKYLSKRPISVEDGEARDIIISPGFRSVAAMAGWDEEALLFASLIVEDTPERESKHKKRVNLQSKTPPTNSRRKRRTQRTTTSPVSSNPIVVLNLDDDETEVKDKDNTKKTEPKIEALKEKNKEDEKKEASPTQISAALPCMDKLKEELSCAICLEICFEPSTTPCGHSFCKKCLKSAADKCGKKCPKCRQLIGNGRSCTVNTVLWNTIQLLFPQEVEARKAAAAGAIKSREEFKNRSPEMEDPSGRTRSSARISSMAMDREMRMNLVRSRRGVPPSQAEHAALAFRSRRSTPSQAEDAALAFRLQREEFMDAFRGSDEQVRIGGAPPISSARENIRAMASRAINVRIRTRPL